MRFIDAIINIPKEGIISFKGQWWQRVSVRYFDGTVSTPRYYHIDCSSITDDNGNCLVCHSLSP